MFVHGQKDHHDSANRWKEMVKNGEVYEVHGGTHFFTHETKFMNQFNETLEKFAERCFGGDSKQENQN